MAWKGKTSNNFLIVLWQESQSPTQNEPVVITEEYIQRTLAGHSLPCDLNGGEQLLGIKFGSICKWFKAIQTIEIKHLLLKLFFHFKSFIGIFFSPNVEMF